MPPPSSAVRTNVEEDVDTGASLLATGTFTFHVSSKPPSLLMLPTNTQPWRGLTQHCCALQDVCLSGLFTQGKQLRSQEPQLSPATAPLSHQDGASGDFKLMRRNKIRVGFRSFL